MAQRILDALGEPFAIDARDIHVQASIGIASAAQAAEEADDADQLMRNADLAMYRAKATGRGGFAEYHPQMHIALVERLQLEADLRRALERGELELHYQPTIDLATGEITGLRGAGALAPPAARSDHRPLDFIPLAEATGLIRAARPVGPA